MAKHFGMRFVDSDMLSEMKAIGRQRQWDGGILATHVIHPDSLPLLEPKTGDAVIVNQGMHDFLCVVAKLSDTRTFRHELTRDQIRLRDIKSIIQRDGKPFHFPESEAA
jgi:hypothetical protein